MTWIDAQSLVSRKINIQRSSSYPCYVSRITDIKFRINDTNYKGICISYTYWFNWVNTFVQLIVHIPAIYASGHFIRHMYRIIFWKIIRSICSKFIFQHVQIQMCVQKVWSWRHFAIVILHLNRSIRNQCFENDFRSDKHLSNFIVCTEYIHKEMTNGLEKVRKLNVSWNIAWSLKKNICRWICFFACD